MVRGADRLRQWGRAAVVCALLAPGLAGNQAAHAIFINGDMEHGDFTAWDKKFGLNYGLSGSPPFNESNIKVSAGGKELLSIVGHEFDPRAPQLILPREGNFTAKVNDEGNSYHVNIISQRGVIAAADRDPVDGKLHVRFTYAAVLEDPNHGPTVQPYFHVLLKDLSTDTTLYDDFAYSNQPGRVFFTTAYKGSLWRSTPFIDVDMEVPDTSLGHEIEVRVLGADCAAGGHGGYVYVDAFGSLAILPQGSCISDLRTRAKPGKVQLSWTDNGAARYKVYRAESLQGPFVPLGVTQSRYATWLDETVSAGGRYYYTVRPVDADGHEICSSGEIVGVAPPLWNVGDPLNHPPILGSHPPLVGDVRAVYTYQALASDADGDPLRYSLLYAPLGMSVDAATGLLSWQPDATGTYRVNLAVEDDHGHMANQAFAIEVSDRNRPPVIDNPLPIRVPAGVDFGHDLQASDPDGDAMLYTMGSQAVGLVVDASGWVRWPSPQPGRYPVTVVVADVHGARTRQQLVIEVQAFPVFISYPVIRATTNVQYVYPAQAQDVDSPTLSYTLENGPASMSVDATTGIVRWTPPASGSFPVILDAMDPEGNTGRQSYTIVVSDTANRAPEFTAVPVVYIAYPSAYSYTASASDPDGDTLLWTLKQGPAGMEIIPSTGRITWQFNQNISGVFPVEVEVYDRRGGVATQRYDLRVPSATNRPPTITSTPGGQVKVGATYTYPITTTDADGEPVSLQLLQAPTGMTLSGNVLGWQTDVGDLGQHTLEIQADDPRGGYARQSWVLDVVPASVNRAPRINSTPAVTGTAGKTYTYQLSATDPDGDPLSYSLLTAPDGMSISNTGRVEWAVPAGTVGSFTVEIKVADDQGLYVVQNYLLGVGGAGNRPPRITSTPALTGTAGANYVYQIAATDPDGDALTYALSAAPPGMIISDSGRITWTPTVAALGYQGVTLTVSDGKGATATQSYTLYVQSYASNRPPKITSTPAFRAKPGVNYQYNVIAADPDSDPLTYALAQGPAGMIVSDTGLLSWADPTAGTHAVEIVVFDPHGAGVSQSYTLTVAANSAPVITSAPVTAATVATAYSYPVQANDADGDFLTYQLVTRPAGMTISATGVVEWTPASAGSFNVTLRVSDGQATQEQRYTIVVHSASTPAPFDFTLQATPQYVAPGSSVTLQAFPTGGTGPYTLGYFNVNNGNQSANVANFTLNYTPATTGKYTVNVRIRDSKNVTLTRTLDFWVTDGSDTTPPQVELTSPARSDDITVAELSTEAEILGTVSDANLASYELLLSPVGENTWSVIGRGTQSVINGKLGSLNPRTLANGQYELGLIAVDTSGNQSSAKIGILIFGEQKIGQFSLSFTDFELEVGGLPLQLTRTYDTRRQREALDFGHGWSVDYQNIKVQTNGIPGRAWELRQIGSGLNRQFCVYAAGARTASVRLPDGKMERFDIKASPECVHWSQMTANPFFGIEFIPKAGTTSQLEATDVGQLRIVNDELYDYDTLGPTDPQQFKLTARDGTHYILDKSFGIRQIKDRHGNTLSYTPNGIHHSGGLSLSFTRDGQGRITRVDTPDGRQRHYHYDAQGNLQTATDPKNQHTQHTYSSSSSTAPHQLEEIHGADGKRIFKATFDAQGQLISQTDGKGYTVNLTHDTATHQDLARDRRGNTTTYDYDDQGNITRLTDPLGGLTTYTYDAHGNELSVTDPLGRTTTREYDAWGGLTRETDPLGHITQSTYNAFGHPVQLTDPLGRLTQNTYNANGSLTKITDPLGHATTLGYTPQGELTALTDPLGHQTRYSYTTANGKTLKTSETDPAGHTTTYTYDAAGNETGRKHTVTLNGAATELTTRQSWDANGNLLSRTDEQGHTTTYQYDVLNQLIQETDPQGRLTRHDYNERGEKLKTTWPDGSTTTTTYDQNGNETQSCERGVCTTTQYDALDRSIKTTNALNQTTTTTLDAAGQPAQSTDALGHTTTYQYDAAGRKTKETDPAGNETTYTFDAVGNLLSETNAAAHTTTYTYNERNQRIKTTLPTGSAITHTYDAAGRKTHDTDAQGKSTTYTYNPLGQLTSVTDPEAHTTTYTYDERGQLNSQTDANTQTTTYAYNATGQRTRRTLPDGHSETWSYDNLGQQLTHTDLNGQTTHRAYNDAGQLRTQYRPDGSTVTYTYNNHGYLTAVTDTRDAPFSINPDALDHPTRLNVPVTGSLDYTWNANSQKTQLKYGTPQIDYAYDATGKLSQITADGKTTPFSYDPSGRRTRITRSNGTHSDTHYNAAGQITAVLHQDASDTTFASFIYTLDANGRRTKVEETLDGQIRTLHYTYDNTGKLKSETVSEGNHTSTTQYTFDATGNRISKETDGTLTHYLYNSRDQLIQESSDGQLTSYTYDANGNLTSKTTPNGTTITYAWNTENRLTQIDNAATGEKISYGYDATGNRISKTRQAGGTKTETQWLIDSARPYSEIVTERTRVNNSAWSTTATYVHTPDGVGELISQTNNGQTRHIYQDAQGSSRIIGSDANIEQVLSFDAFGNRTDAFGYAASTDALIDHQYVGEYFDADSGLYHLRARDYDPRIGRFTAMDEHPGAQKAPLTINKYNYANSDPVNNIDPSGRFTLGGMMSGIGSMAQMTAMSTIRMELSGRIADALLSPLVDSVIGAVSAAGTMENRVVYGNAGFSQLLSALAMQCAVTKRCFLKKVPVLVNGFNSPMTSTHIMDALNGNGDTLSGSPMPLPFVLLKGQKRDDVNPSVRGASRQCKGKPNGFDCDEYPYASSMNGGNAMYHLDGVSLRAVPSSDNRRQGGKLGRFYTANNLTYGKPYINLAMPWMPTFFIDKNGKVHY
ncbi:hypothetical protein FACS189497_09610 [Betaproteobacteria bacterium]|nr:hypothetical protein FACS189488_06690 [Betaproteobacteria bacterium]GHU30214.1 hypothetical protein FACS189497_09610 [Betaproteobacteria bacterium]